MACREVGGKREHKLRVYSELIFGHEANKPAPGTRNLNRTCMPYPFKGEMTVQEAASDFKIAIDGFKKTGHLGIGVPAAVHLMAGFKTAVGSAPHVHCKP